MTTGNSHYDPRKRKDTFRILYILREAKTGLTMEQIVLKMQEIKENIGEPYVRKKLTSMVNKGYIVKKYYSHCPNCGQYYYNYHVTAEGFVFLKNMEELI